MAVGVHDADDDVVAEVGDEPFPPLDQPVEHAIALVQDGALAVSRYLGWAVDDEHSAGRLELTRDLKREHAARRQRDRDVPRRAAPGLGILPSPAPMPGGRDVLQSSPLTPPVVRSVRSGRPSRVPKPA
jgi:hypothetical protein